jgi:hypothetical protein
MLRLLKNYRFRLSIPAFRPRLPGLPIFLTPDKQKEECQNR